jgi:hypothetical protein
MERLKQKENRLRFLDDEKQPVFFSSDDWLSQLFINTLSAFSRFDVLRPLQASFDHPAP